VAKTGPLRSQGKSIRAIAAPLENEPLAVWLKNFPPAHLAMGTLLNQLQCHAATQLPSDPYEASARRF